MGRSYSVVEDTFGPTGALYRIDYLDGRSPFLEFAQIMDTHECSQQERERCVEIMKCEHCINECGLSEYSLDFENNLDDVVENGYEYRFPFLKEKGYASGRGYLGIGPIRVYGLLFSRQIFIAVSGVIKQCVSTYDDPKVREAYEIISRIEYRLLSALNYAGGEGTTVNTGGGPGLPEHILSATYRERD